MNSTLISLKRFFLPIKPSVPCWNFNAAVVRSELIVRGFYAILAAMMLLNLDSWSKYLHVSGWDFLWPVGWLNLFSPPAGSAALLGLYFAILLAAACLPGAKALRILVFVAVLLKTALANSLGKIDHNDHLTVYLSFILIFVPGLDWKKLPNRKQGAALLHVVATCQKVILLTYSMSGLGKLVIGFWQLAHGQSNSFSHDALARQIAGRLLEGDSSSLLGPWLIEHPGFGWPMMLGAIYMQFFAFWAAFRPRLHRLWALGLLLFHASVFLTMNLHFKISPFLIGLFLLLSPFAPGGIRWREIPADLPLFGRWLKK